MGLNQSRHEAVTTAVVESVTNATVSNSQSCASSSQQTSDINITVKNNSHLKVGKLDISQVANVDATCLQTAENNFDIVKQIKIDLEQKAGQAITGGFFNISESKQINESIQKLTTGININNIKSCILNVVQAQKANIVVADNSSAQLGEVIVQQVVNSVAKCIQKDSAVMNAIDEVSSQQKSVSEQTISWFDTKGLIAIAVILVVIVVIYVVMKKSMFSSSGKD